MLGKDLLSTRVLPVTFTEYTNPRIQRGCLGFSSRVLVYHQDPDYFGPATLALLAHHSMMYLCISIFLLVDFLHFCE